jgi:hypothetical protein
MVPVQIEDVPPGYEHLWEIVRTDADECAIKLAHINPGQIVNATILMDEVPIAMPDFRCPMANVLIKEIKPVEMATILRKLRTCYFRVLV